MNSSNRATGGWLVLFGTAYFFGWSSGFPPALEVGWWAVLSAGSLVLYQSVIRPSVHSTPTNIGKGEPRVKVRQKHLVLLGLFSVGFFFAAEALIDWVLAGSSGDSATATAPEDLGRACEALGVTFLLVVPLASPIVEEVVFRGVLYDFFRQRFGVPTTVIGTSLLFTLSHFLGRLDLAGGLKIFLAGLVYGGLRAWSGGVALPIVIHVVGNALPIVALVFFCFSV